MVAKRHKITNVPLFKKLWDIIFFFWDNNFLIHFSGHFEGAKTFLTPKLSRAQRGTILGSKKSRPPRNIPRNGPLCSLPKTKKNNIPNFQNQRCIGIFMSLYFFLRYNFFEFAYFYINSRMF